MTEYLIPIAIANLISEQSIVRNIINRIFNPNGYLNWKGPKRFIYDLISCWTCLTVWVSVIFLIINGKPIDIQYIYTPLVNMLVVDIIQKIKR